MKANVLPMLYFGEVGEPGIDWRKQPEEIDPDDEEMAVTPPDVVEMLGFDPREFSEERV